MPRPIKNGVDYFPLDVHLDEKFELIEAEFGLTGFAVVVKLLQRIYGQDGYYCEWNDEVALLFGKRIGLGGSAVSEIVSASIRRGLFDQTLYDRYQILTSAGIQKRYFEAVARRKVVNVEAAYLLVEVTQAPENVHINRVNVDINPENVCNNPQTKENKTKGKKIREKNDARARDGGLIAYITNNLTHMSAGNMEELREMMADGMTDELVRYAVDIACGRNIRTWAYVRGILDRWICGEIHTLAEAKEESRRKSDATCRGYSRGEDKPRATSDGEEIW